MNNKQKPIGWYLKEVDALLTKQMNVSLAEKKINRVQWQILTNVSSSGFITTADFFKEVKRFVDLKELDILINDLKKRKLLVEKDFKIELTNIGVTKFKEIKVIQDNNRTQTMQKITDEDFQTTIKVLAQIVNNLNDSMKDE
jgi:hypothetical protein